MRFVGRNLDKAPLGPCYDVLLVSSFGLTVECLKRRLVAKVMLVFEKLPLEARSWASRNVMAQSSTFGLGSVIKAHKHIVYVGGFSH
ncbi:hypothetical protein Hanom_Chr01g00003351 [Helianthus anomalus]